MGAISGMFRRGEPVGIVVGIVREGQEGQGRLCGRFAEDPRGVEELV
jgi:hypothetical protein